LKVSLLTCVVCEQKGRQLIVFFVLWYC